MFERAAASKKSRQCLLQLIPYCSSVEIGEWTQRKTNAVYWFNKHKYRIKSLLLTLPEKSHCLICLWLIRQCKKLTSISVVSNSSATISDMLILCRDKPQITSFGSDRKIGITDAELTELVCACPNMEYLNLHHDTRITDIGVRALSEHCPSLCNLYIQASTQVTEGALLHLLQRCCQFESLGVSRKSLSDQTAAQLPAKIRLLRT